MPCSRCRLLGTRCSVWQSLSRGLSWFSHSSIPCTNTNYGRVHGAASRFTSGSTGSAGLVIRLQVGVSTADCLNVQRQIPTLRSSTNSIRLGLTNFWALVTLPVARLSAFSPFSIFSHVSRRHGAVEEKPSRLGVEISARKCVSGRIDHKKAGLPGRA